MSFDIGGDILYADAVTTPPVFMITENPITSSNESLFIVNGVP